MLQWLYTYLASSHSQCFMCFFWCMLQVGLYVYCIYFHTYDASGLSRCCACLQWFQVFLDIFASVLDAYFKCFICFQTYVAIVASGCFNTRSGVASVSLPFCCLALVLGARRWRQSPLARASPTCLQANAPRETWASRAWDARWGTAARASVYILKFYLKYWVFNWIPKNWAWPTPEEINLRVFAWWVNQSLFAIDVDHNDCNVVVNIACKFILGPG